MGAQTDKPMTWQFVWMRSICLHPVVKVRFRGKSDTLVCFDASEVNDCLISRDIRLYSCHKDVSSSLVTKLILLDLSSILKTSKLILEVPGTNDCSFWHDASLENGPS